MSEEEEEFETQDEYTLKESELVGQLYAVLVDKHGNIIDGKQRLKADPNWKKEVLKNIDNDERLIVARGIANWHRRNLCFDEKQKIVNNLAQLYLNQGCKVLTTKNEVKRKIMNALKLSSPTVNKYLDKKYKAFIKEDVSVAPRIAASEVIKHTLGEKCLERVKKEIMEDYHKPIRHFHLSRPSSRRNETTVENMIEEQEHIGSTMSLDQIFVAIGQSNLEKICDPLERFNEISVNILMELDEQQKQHVLDTLLTTEKKIRELIFAIKNPKMAVH